MRLTGQSDEESTSRFIHVRSASLAPPRRNLSHPRISHITRFSADPVPENILFNNPFLLPASRLEDDLLDLHLIKQGIALDSLMKRHNILKHEPAISRQTVSPDVGRRMEEMAYPSRCCFFSSRTRASEKMLRTGHRPICRRRFLLYAFWSGKILLGFRRTEQ